MSSPLTVKVDLVNGTIRFSHIIFLGSEYEVAWTGLAEGSDTPTIALFDCDGDALCVSDPSDDSFNLNTMELIALFNDGAKRTVGVHAYVYLDSAILATGITPCYWSPLTFDVSPDPVSILGIQAYWDSHVDDTANPHNVVLAQLNAAADNHTHPYVGVRYVFDDGITRVIHPTLIEGRPSFYWEEVT